MNLALKDIRADWVRFLLAAIGLGAILVATMGINGLYRGIVFEALLMIDNIGADLWVVQGERMGPFAETSYVTSALDLRLEGVPGVRTARRFIQFNKQFIVDNRRKGISIVGLDYPKDQGEWLPLISGRQLQSAHYEAVADKSLGVVVGDTLRLGRDDYSIVGVTSGQVDLGGDPLLFVSIPDAQAIDQFVPSEAVLLNRQANRTTLGRGQYKGNVAAVILELQPGADLASVRDLILRWGDVNVLSKQQQRDTLLNGRLWRLRIQILAFVVTMFAVAGGVVAVTIFNMTIAKIPSIALLKLIGSPDRVIVSMIVQSSLLLGCIAYGGAMLVAHQLYPHFPRTVVLLASDHAQFFVLTMLICIAASWVGINRAFRVHAREVLA
ncbi:MAG: ABC transporter permease [Rhodoblastus sp.]